MSMRFITAAFVLAATTLFAVTAGAVVESRLHEKDMMKNVRAKEVKMTDGSMGTVYVFETENGGGQFVAIPREKLAEDMRHQL
jgi:hypothetical protein